MRYDNYADSSVTLALDLINDYGTATRTAAGRGEDPLPELGAFLDAHDLDAKTLHGDTQHAAQRLADRLHTVFTTDDAGEAVAVVNAVLAEAKALPQVSGHDGQDWHLHYHCADASAIDRLAVMAAMGLATVLCTSGTGRLGRCDGVDCGDVFVDTSRNNRRRFCWEGCANRTHVAEHRARRRAETS